MRKIRLLLPILALIVVVLVIGLSACSKPVYEAKRASEINLGEETFARFETISKTYSDRSIGSEATVSFINYIKGELSSFGYEVIEQEFTSDNSKTAKNIVAKGTQKEGKGKIVIGAAWDNYYKDFEAHPDGAYQTGAAIAALLSTAKELSTKDLSYNLEIVFFAGSTDHWSGAQYYLSKLTAQEKQDIKLFINYGCIVGGDNVYIYSRDKDVNYDSFVRQVIDVNGIQGISKTPLFKNPFDANVVQKQVYQYSHIGMIGNNIAFMNEYILSMNFLSINWSDLTNPVCTEKSGYENVLETSNDTFDNMISRSSKDVIINQFNSVINTTIYSVVDNQEELLKSIEDSKDVNPILQSSVTYYIANIVVKILLIAIVLIIGAYAKSVISKHKEEYTKLAQATPQVKIDLSKLRDGQLTEKDLEEIFRAEEAKLKGETNDKDKTSNDDDNISDDDVFQ